jgi:acyl-CoA synthetase (AMP-forming)/AMP-acid ligase II
MTKEPYRIAEIKALFARHPDVPAVLAAGVPDERLREGLHIPIVRKPGSAIKAEELKERAAGRLEKFKTRDGIYFVAALPLAAIGKATAGCIELERAGSGS